jgi:hypothetical protein
MGSEPVVLRTNFQCSKERKMKNILSMTTVFAVLAWVVSMNMAHADSVCAALVYKLAVEADMLKSESDATVKFIARGIRPFSTPEQMAEMAGDLKRTADEAKMRCSQ